MPNYDEVYEALKTVYTFTGVIHKIMPSPWGVFTEAIVYNVITEEQYNAAREYFGQRWYRE